MTETEKIYRIEFELKSGNLVKSQLSESQLELLKSGEGLTSQHWYEGSPLLGSWSEYSCFDGAQIVKWKAYKHDF